MDSAREKPSKNKKTPRAPTVTYGEVGEIAKALVEAQSLPKNEMVVQDRDEIISLLKDGIIEYLKKGYSTLATVKFINSKAPSIRITDDDIKALLPFVTKKKRSRGKEEQTETDDKQNNENSSIAQVADNPPKENKDMTIEEIRGLIPQTITLDEKIYLEVPFDRGGLNPEKDKVKKLGAIYEPDITKWHVKPGDDIRKFLEWLSVEDFKRLTEYDKPVDTDKISSDL
jgi:hypothetical protein